MIDKNKTYVTSGGLAVNIYRTDAGGEFPVHGALLVDQRWTQAAWRADGTPAPFAPRQALIEVKTNKEPAMIDKTKTYTTCDGLPVQIYRTDGGGIHPVHGAVFIDGCWLMAAWQADGKSFPFVTRDLVEVKPKRTLDVHLNVYSTNDGVLTVGSGYPTRAAAITNAIRVGGRFACVRLTQEVTEGEGL